MRSPLQNRVDPFGEIHAVPTRGTLMGNRGGCLHDHRRQLGRRRWISRHWIACELAFNGRHRTVMTPGRYTELFFLDEATALAAGHRPCFECRWQEARAFATAWACAFDLSPPPRADAMDVRLHAERLVSTRASVSSPRVRPAELPNGAMVTFPTDENDRSAWLVQDGKLWRWSFAGYSLAMPVTAVKEAELLTAPAIVATLAAGYRPRIHASARDGCMEHPLHATSLPPAPWHDHVARRPHGPGTHDEDGDWDAGVP